MLYNTTMLSWITQWPQNSIVKLGLCDNRKTYISITINNKSYFISINNNVSIMRLCHKMVFQVQIMIVCTMGKCIYSTATSSWLSVLLYHDDIQQYTEIYHYLNNFNNTRITVDYTISYIAITIITLSLLSHSPNPNRIFVGYFFYKLNACI